MDGWLAQSRESDPFHLIRRATLIVLAVEMVLLAFTGIWLIFNYRPSAAAAWFDLRPHRYALDVRLVHRDIGHLGIPTSLAACGLVIADAIVHGAGRRDGSVFPDERSSAPGH